MWSPYIVPFASAAVAFLLSGALIGSLPLALLSIPSLTLAALVWVVRLPQEVRVTRLPLRQVYWVGDEIDVVWELEVAEGFGLVVLSEEGHPQWFALTQGRTLRLAWKGFPALHKRYSYRLRCTKRGEYTFPATRWSVLDPFRFREQSVGSLDNAFSYRVLPRTLGVRRVKHLRALAAAPVPTLDRAKIGVTTTDFRELRDYHYGDPLSAINWKATARQSWKPGAPPLVNEYEVEGRKAVWLFLDASPSMSTGTSVDSPLERGIDAASSIGYFFLQRGYRLGASFYSAKNSTFLLPELGMKQFVRFSRSLSQVEASPRGKSLLEAVAQCRQHLLLHHPLSVIVTRLDAGEPRRFAEGLRRLSALSSRGRFRPPILIININGYFFASPRDDVEQAAVDFVALRTRPVVRALRRHGAHILQWNPTRESFGEVLLRQVRLP